MQDKKKTQFLRADRLLPLPLYLIFTTCETCGICRDCLYKSQILHKINHFEGVKDKTNQIEEANARAAWPRYRTGPFSVVSGWLGWLNQWATEVNDRILHFVFIRQIVWDWKRTSAAKWKDFFIGAAAENVVCVLCIS